MKINDPHVQAQKGNCAKGAFFSVLDFFGKMLNFVWLCCRGHQLNKVFNWKTDIKTDSNVPVALEQQPAIC